MLADGKPAQIAGKALHRRHQGQHLAPERGRDFRHQLGSFRLHKKQQLHKQRGIRADPVAQERPRERRPVEDSVDFRDVAPSDVCVFALRELLFGPRTDAQAVPCADSSEVSAYQVAMRNAFQQILLDGGELSHFDSESAVYCFQAYVLTCVHLRDVRSGRLLRGVSVLSLFPSFLPALTRRCSRADSPVY